jgi:hypothetical protein
VTNAQCWHGLTNLAINVGKNVKNYCGFAVVVGEDRINQARRIYLS